MGECLGRDFEGKGLFYTKGQKSPYRFLAALALLPIPEVFLPLVGSLAADNSLSPTITIPFPKHTYRPCSIVFTVHFIPAFPASGHGPQLSCHKLPQQEYEV